MTKLKKLLDVDSEKLKTKNKSNNSLIGAVNNSNLAVVKEEEIRVNYEKAKESLESVIGESTDILREAKEAFFAAPQQSVYVERIAGLVRAINESSMYLASLHKEADGLLGGIKNLEIDNSKQELKVDSSTISEFISNFKDGTNPSIDLKENEEGVYENGELEEA